MRSPGSPVRAFRNGFVGVAFPAGLILTFKTLAMGSFAEWLGFLPYLVGFVFVGGLLGGSIVAVPILIQGWAWRKIAEGTPVSKHDEGLGA